MKKYILQLLSDLEAAKENKPKKVNYRLLYPDHPATDPQYDGVMDYMIEWENAPEWEMDKLFGIKGEAFPPVEQLTDEEAEDIAIGILELWASFNIVTNTYNDTPAKVVYEVLTNYWRTETIQYISEGTLHLELCEYEIEDCPWGLDFCSCLEHQALEETEEEMENNDTSIMDDGGSELPF